MLRRDLSLNRRLHRWLLGANDESSQQISYFKNNGLVSICETLKVGPYIKQGRHVWLIFKLHMSSNQSNGSSSSASAVPWKIFNFLLDKWEIGGPLTDCLIYDALESCYDFFSIDSSHESEVCSFVALV